MNLDELVRAALEEDRADHDVTTLATVPEGVLGRGRLLARSACIVAGLDAFEAVFATVDPSIKLDRVLDDGAQASPGDVVATVDGPLRSILTAERTALNLVQRLSGTATLTKAFVLAAGSAVVIRDTRKTTPGLRALEKAAVRAGGGTNHRNDLDEAILIKDNHIVAAGGIEPAVRAAKATGRWVEVECDTLEHVRAALAAAADEILLDNMDIPTLRTAVELIGGRARTEASGGISLANVREVAATGVDSISVGALTHSAPAVDLSLEVS